MRVGVLVTNGGAHPPEKWAAETAAQIADIIQIEPSAIAYDEMMAEKERFIVALETALSDHHGTVQKHEVSKIGEHKHNRFDHPIEPEQEHVDEAVASVQAVAAKTLFASHFRKPEVIKFVESTIGSHFASIRHIERSWYADKNLDHPKAAAFRNQYHG